MCGHSDTVYEPLGALAGFQFLSHVLNIQYEGKIFMKRETNIAFSHLRVVDVLITAAQGLSTKGKTSFKAFPLAKPSLAKSSSFWVGL